MESFPSFSLELRKGDNLFSFDIQSGYHYFYLQPDMRDMLLFHYSGRVYQ